LIVRFQTSSGSSAIAARDARDAGGVRHREVVSGLQRQPRPDLELAAEVGEKRPVRDVDDLGGTALADCCDDAREVRVVVGEYRDVAELRPPFDADEIDRAEQSAGLADRRREPRERARPVVEPDPERGTEGRGRMHVSTLRLSARGCLGRNYAAGSAVDAGARRAPE